MYKSARRSCTAHLPRGVFEQQQKGIDNRKEHDNREMDGSRINALLSESL